MWRRTPINLTELARLDATAQADLVRNGDVMPTELVEAAIEAVEQLDPQLDAVFIRTHQHALKHARTVSRDAPFPGVPILVKDIALELEGYPYGHGGLRLLRDRGHVSDRTTYLAAALRDAGFAFLGRSTSALQGVELGVSDLALHTMPRNPWNTDHATGGSSSGSAAAVAAGLVPLAHGNDGGGSLRMPAALLRGGRPQAHPGAGLPRPAHQCRQLRRARLDRGVRPHPDGARHRRDAAPAQRPPPRRPVRPGRRPAHDRRRRADPDRDHHHPVPGGPRAGDRRRRRPRRHRDRRPARRAGPHGDPGRPAPLRPPRPRLAVRP